MKNYLYLQRTAFKVVLTLFVAFIGCVCGRAQTDFEEGYTYLYSSAHRMKVRKMVNCTQDGQVLWNGAYVRRDNRQVCIYRDSTCLVCAHQVWLEHTGYYSVTQDDGSQALFDANGRPTGLAGEELIVLWDGTVCVLMDDTYYLYTSDNQRIGTISSDVPIEIYHNGCYCFHRAGFYYVALPSGNVVDNCYSDTKPELADDGVWRCKYNGRVYWVDKAGNTAY